MGGAGGGAPEQRGKRQSGVAPGKEQLTSLRNSPIVQSTGLRRCQQCGEQLRWCVVGHTVSDLGRAQGPQLPRQLGVTDMAAHVLEGVLKIIAHS